VSANPSEEELILISKFAWGKDVMV
jgi:hypothetical protein